jgi:hypothetical protein
MKVPYDPPHMNELAVSRAFHRVRIESSHAAKPQFFFESVEVLCEAWLEILRFMIMLGLVEQCAGKITIVFVTKYHSAVPNYL